MKISVDGVELFNLTDVQKSVIKNDIPSEIFEDDMKRRIQYILTHKFERSMERLRKEWEPKLKNRGVSSFPADDEAFAQLVFTQTDYKNRSEREVKV